MNGNGVVSPSDGEKNLGGFYAPPQPQNGGTISGVSYTLTWNNPNVATTTTANPYANVIATIAPLPGKVSILLCLSNFPVTATSSTMNWTWTAPNFAAGYQILLAQYINGAWQAPVTNYTGSTNYTFTGIWPGTPCEIIVSATNVSGIGPASDPAWPYAATPPLPSQVVGLTATTNLAVATNSSTMIWTWPTPNFAAGYQIIFAQYKQGVWQPPATNYAPAPPYAFTGIAPGTPCEIIISATNVTGIGPASGTAWPYAAAVPQIPGYVSVTTNLALAAGNATMSFAWSPGTNALGYAAVLAHYLNGAWQAPVTNATTSTKMTYSNLMPGDPYEFYVVPTNAAGIGFASSIDWPYAASYTLPELSASLVLSNRFGFWLTGQSNQVVVIEACTNLAAPQWVPLQTNTMGTNSQYFYDANWTNYGRRFYRIHAP
jgi:hypothetical protein